MCAVVWKSFGMMLWPKLCFIVYTPEISETMNIFHENDTEVFSFTFLILPSASSYIDHVGYGASYKTA